MAKRNRLVGLLLFFSSCSLCYGSENSPFERSISFNVHSTRPVSGLSYAVYNEDGAIRESIPLRFRTGGRSEVYNYRGPANIVFYEEEPRPTAEDPNAVFRRVKARATIPERMNEVLFVFVPQGGARQSSGENDYRIIVIDDSESAVPWGGLMVYNGTSVELLGNVSGGSRSSTTINFAPGQNKPEIISPTGRVQLAYKFHDEFWQLVFADNFSCSADERLILLIFPPRNEGARQLRGGLIRGFRVSDES